MPPQTFAIICCDKQLNLELDDFEGGDILYFGTCPTCRHEHRHAVNTTVKLVTFRVTFHMPNRTVSNEEADAMLQVAHKAIKTINHEFAIAAWGTTLQHEDYSITIEAL